MKKRLTSIIIAVLFCFMATGTAFASDPRVVDQADLLSASEESELMMKLDEISERQQLDVVVVTVPGLAGKSPQEFADDYYDYHNYGFGAEKDGILLLVSMEERDWYITTTGFGITAFTDAGIEYLSDQILFWLSDGYYAEAFHTYADQCDIFITQAYTGEPYDVNNLPREPLSIIWIGISLIVGFIMAISVTGSMKSQLKTIRREPAAGSYVVDGSVRVTESREFFLYRNITRREKPKSNSKGGSSTHRGSSGTFHGGGGGKF